MLFLITINYREYEYQDVNRFNRLTTEAYILHARSLSSSEVFEWDYAEDFNLFLVTYFFAKDMVSQDSSSFQRTHTNKSKRVY